MPAYEIKILPTHNEITILGKLSRTLVATILGELVETRDFPHRNAIWVFTETAESPSFEDFDGIVEELHGFIPRAIVDKRVGLVSKAGMTNSLLKLWHAAAHGLPFKLEVFQDYDNALDWVSP